MESTLKLEFSTVVFVGIEVGGDHDPIAELATSKCLLRFLAVSNAVELNKYLWNKKIY